VQSRQPQSPAPEHASQNESEADDAPEQRERARLKRETCIAADGST
jgi:hypothetical protein